jgi:hypothetical protein
VRVLKLALISIVFLFVVVTAISLLIPSHVRISKAINIHGQKDSVFQFIGDTTEWKFWHPAFMPNDSFESFPAISIVQQSQNDSEIVMHLQQLNKPEVVNAWKVYHHQSTDSLTLQWYMDFHLKWYPWRKFGSLLYERTYGTMMEQGLENLKAKVEDNQ